MFDVKSQKMKQKNMLRYLDIIINQVNGTKNHIKFFNHLTFK